MLLLHLLGSGSSQENRAPGARGALAWRWKMPEKEHTENSQRSSKGESSAAPAASPLPPRPAAARPAEGLYGLPSAPLGISSRSQRLRCSPQAEASSEPRLKGRGSRPKLAESAEPTADGSHYGGCLEATLTRLEGGS